VDRWTPFDVMMLPFLRQFVLGARRSWSPGAHDAKGLAACKRRRTRQNAQPAGAGA